MKGKNCIGKKNFEFPNQTLFRKLKRPSLFRGLGVGDTSVAMLLPPASKLGVGTLNISLLVPMSSSRSISLNLQLEHDFFGMASRLSTVTFAFQGIVLWDPLLWCSIGVYSVL